MHSTAITKFFFFLSLVLFLTTSPNCKAGEIILNGTYQGKNLYVQNTFSGNQQEFCATDVLVNNVRVSTNLNVSAFEIDLSFLQPNDEVTIKIVHKDGCKPKVLNSTVIKSITHFHFVSVQISEQNVQWATKDEKQSGKFYVEQFLHNSWVIVHETEAQGGTNLKNYSVKANHHSGLNKYRIRFRDPNGHYFYSKVAEYASTKEAVSFTPKKAVNIIHLSQHAHYEVLDENGVSLLKGSGLQISVANLKPGEYYLNIDNHTEKFSKH